MSKIEKMQRYIERTPIPSVLEERYDINVSEWMALLYSNDPVDAVALAFSYGRAKGYRAAKAKTKEAVLT